MQVALTPDQLKAKWEGYCNPALGCQTACCHFEGSPCEHLEWVEADKQVGRCKIYSTRFGQRTTVDGKVFRCAPAAEWIQHVNPPETCGYARVLRIHGVPTVRGKMVREGNGVPMVRGMA